jgi:chitin disaccharide deacetylase
MSSMHLIKQHYFPTLAERLGYSDKDILVIVNIDDVGLHKDVTVASFKALKFGMVKTGSIMVPAPNFEQVIKLWQENPEIDLGIHLTLTSDEWGEKYSGPTVRPKTDVPSLYSPQGIMWKTDEAFIMHAKKKDMENEMEAQIKKVLDTGLKPSHLDHHMSIYGHPDFLSILVELSRKYKLPMHLPGRRRYMLPFIKNNLFSLRRRGHVFPDTQMGIYQKGEQNLTLDFWKARYHDRLRSLKPGVHIIKVHIAFQTKELQDITGLHDSSIRQIDYDVWTSDDTKKLAEDLGITFIGYRPLQHLQGILMSC